VSGLVEKLEVIQSQLSLCEKALAEYLETKRLAFPRFYFASSNDLLVIKTFLKLEFSYTVELGYNEHSGTIKKCSL